MFTDSYNPFEEGASLEGPEGGLEAQTPSEILDVPALFLKDVALYKAMSDEWVDHLFEADKAEPADGEWNFLTNTERSAYNRDLVVDESLRQRRLPIRIKPRATYPHSNKVVPDFCSVYYRSDFGDALRFDGELMTKLEAAFPLMTKDLALTTPYARTVTLIGGVVTSIAVNELPGAPDYPAARALFPEWGDDQVQAWIPRIFMTRVLADVLKSPYVLSKTRDVHLQQPIQQNARAYAKLAEAGVRPLGIEEYHGIINGVVRDALQASPDILERLRP